VTALLELRDVCAGYGPFRAIFDVSFSVPEGGVIALLGANGAGKSTIARVVTGLVPIERGALIFAGEDISRAKAWQITRRGIVHAPEGRSVFASLTVEENLVLGLARARNRKQVSEGLERAYALFPRLGERRGQDAGTLSGGEQRMLSLARVLVEPPRLLVVDELSLGLAPKIIDELYTMLRRVNEAGTALLIVEQYVARAVSLAQSVVILQHGEVMYDGSVADLGDASDKLLSTHAQLEPR
jgi:branched-chain amino acid transport system ATP-binding protein